MYVWFSSSKMEQITTSLVARPAPKSAVSGSGTEAAGSVTKRLLVVLTTRPSMNTDLACSG